MSPLFLAQRIACLLLCALFLLPAAIVQPALAAGNMPFPEEQGQSNKNDSYIEDSADQDSTDPVDRRAVAPQSPIARSVETDPARCRHFLAHFTAIKLKDIYRNGLGTRLLC